MGLWFPVIASVLRFVSNAILSLEAQRWVFQLLVRPTSVDRLEEAERRVLREAGFDDAEGSFFRHEFVPAGDHQLHTIIVGDERNPPVVLVHGHSMSAAFWCRNFQALVDLRYCVYAVDLLGWGRSDRPEFTGSSFEDTTAYFLNSFVAWKESLGLSSFVLIGHSLGAHLCMEFAYRYPSVPSHLILIAPAAICREVSWYRGFYFSLPPQRVTRRGGFLGYLLLFLKYPKTPEYNTPTSLFDYVFHLASQPSPAGDAAAAAFIEWDNLVPSIKRPLLDRLKPISIPVTLIGGGRDCLIPMDHLNALYDSLVTLCDDVSLHMICESDHCPMLEHPDVFHEILEERLVHAK
mmetsp:Transcript_5199/g.10594  ORF Transcript_5199/g.10594 Transcript_5199/m.10594 type:complete len:349 (-) Transcript_5199:931-1977(-)